MRLFVPRLRCTNPWVGWRFDLLIPWVMVRGSGEVGANRAAVRINTTRLSKIDASLRVVLRRPR